MIRFVFQALLSNISKEHISFYLTNILLSVDKVSKLRSNIAFQRCMLLWYFTGPVEN